MRPPSWKSDTDRSSGNLRPSLRRPVISRLNAPAPILADEIDPDTSWAETPAFEQALLAFAELDAGQG